MKTFYSIVDNYQKVVKLKLQNPEMFKEDSSKSNDTTDFGEY
jgi:hypothetical protein